MNESTFQPEPDRQSLPSIVHDEPEWFVLNKPIGWHSVAARVTDGAPTVEQWLAESFTAQRALTECGLVHRLDLSTSGCLLVARTAQMHQTLRDNFSAGFGGWSIEKKYLALATRGVESRGEFSLCFAGRHKGSAKVTVSEVGHRNERGACRWCVLRAGAANIDATDPRAFDLVEVEVVGPGRRHQIRAGFGSLGHPLAGDSLYRGTELANEWNENFAALHSWKLTITGIQVESPRPRWAELTR